MHGGNAGHSKRKGEESAWQNACELSCCCEDSADQGHEPDAEWSCTSRDGTVAVEDLLQLISEWGPCVECTSDIDEDGSVTVTDLLEVLAEWGECH